MTLLVASIATLALAVPQSPPAPAPETIPLLQRIVVLGASLSDGYGLSQDASVKTGLSDVVHSTILVPHGNVRSTTSLLLFTDPDAFGEKLVAKARAADPTLVIAVDYLFWFGYGVQASDEARLRHLEKGLALLESIPCPLLVGDLPDMRAASEPAPPGGVPPLLVPEQVPSVVALAKLNARIREWAAGRKGVVVVPVADLLARLQSGSAIEIHGNHWAEGARGRLLGPDRLHPTLEGAVALCLAALDRLVRARDDLPAATFDWDAKSVTNRVLESRGKPASKVKSGVR